MNNLVSEENIELYCSLFCGRQDVYARHWEKNEKSGYSPAYDFNWSEFLAFKSQGGSLKDFPNKKLIPLTPDVIKKHLFGAHTIGIYPILSDNTSYFIAADFDGQNWFEDGKNFIRECSKVGLHGYMERSRSGNGCHVWIFFEDAYPCFKSRKIILEIIKKTLKLSEFDKEVSFDRLFPNQDSLVKNGFGNLIALPFQGRKIAEGKTIFIDIENDQPYSDQWEFLSSIEECSTAEIDQIYQTIFETSGSVEPTSNIFIGKTDAIHITLNNKISLKRSQLPYIVIAFLKEKLNFINSEYLIRRRMGKSVSKIEKIFKLIEESGDIIYLPRGFLNQLTEFLKENNISFNIADERPRFKKVKLTSNITLKTDQLF